MLANEITLILYFLYIDHELKVFCFAFYEGFDDRAIA